MLFNARRRLRAVLVVALTLLAGGARAQQAFTLGDVVVYGVGAGGTATLTSAGNPIFLDEYAPDGTLIQSIKMPVSASGGKAIVASGTATQDGLLTRSVDGRCLVIPGYERDLGTGSGSLISGSLTSGAAIPRIVGRVMANGTIDAAAELTDAAILGNFRGAASTDCTSLWVSGSTGGIRFTTFGAAVTTSTLLTGTFVNVRAVAIQSGQLYASSPTRGVAKVGSGLPTTAGASVTRLTGNNDTNDPSAYS